MSPARTCQSCGMPINDGTYCQHCTDENGHLQSFEERLERMTRWLQQKDASVSDKAARQQALAAMAEMPAWRDHPQLKAMRT